MDELSQYDFDLPRELIAQEPLPNRADARLMLIDRAAGTIDHHHVRDLPELLRAEDVLVRNNSRVVPAKLVGFRTNTGGRWQGLYLKSDPATGAWEILTKTRGKLQIGETITVQDRDARNGMLLTVVARTDDGHLVVTPQAFPDDEQAERFTDAGQWLDRFGRIPLPPYIRDGNMVDADIENYQTVFAKDRGSVAAPTAGLHFTDSLISQIRKGQTEICDVTLHVGIGTFRPIETESLDAHEMHYEWGQIDAETCRAVNDRRSGGGRCVAVGTTSVRVLESAAAAGDGTLKPWTGQTNLFIRPPYRYQAVDALMTNFHLPKSTLLVLVSAFASHALTMKAYREAVENEYRFFSYGDCMLIV